MTLSIRDYTIIKVVQTHHQHNIRYGGSRGIQSSCMSLFSVSWTLCKSPSLQDKFDLDSKLGKRDQLFELIGKYLYLAVEDLAEEFLIEYCSINVEFLENKTGETTAGAYQVSITENKNSVQQLGASALLIVSNYILGLIWGNESTIYLFDSHSKDENGNLSSQSIAILLKFDTQRSLQNQTKSVYYNTYSLLLYIQQQFIEIHCIPSPGMPLNVH